MVKVLFHYQRSSEWFRFMQSCHLGTSFPVGFLFDRFHVISLHLMDLVAKVKRFTSSWHHEQTHQGANAVSMININRKMVQFIKNTSTLIVLIKILTSDLKNLRRLWHAYIRNAVRIHKLQLTSVDSWHFTQYQLRMLACSGTTSYWKGSWTVFN